MIYYLLFLLVVTAIFAYSEFKKMNRREENMGYEQLASTPEELRKLEASLVARIERKGLEKEALEEQLQRVRATLRQLTAPQVKS